MVGEYADANKSKFSFTPEEEHNNNFKFAVLVPHTFIDTTQAIPKQYDSFSYSFT